MQGGPLIDMVARLATALSLAVLLVVVALGCGGADDGAEPTVSPSPAARVSPRATPSPVPSPTPSPSPSPPPVETPQPTPTAPPEGSAAVVRKSSTAGKSVVFTFDAGSDVGYTASILDTLKANSITAAFGITGKWAQQNPDLLRRIVTDGHELINHSFDHPSFTGLSTGKPPLTREERWQQLDSTEAIIQDIAGASSKPFFRPPFGDYDTSVNRDIFARGYAYNIMWTVDSRGWQGISAAEIVQRCLSLAEPGAIYVFHVGSASQDGPALQGIIDGLRVQGYSFVSLSQAVR